MPNAFARTGFQDSRACNSARDGGTRFEAGLCLPRRLLFDPYSLSSVRLNDSCTRSCRPHLAHSCTGTRCSCACSGLRTEGFNIAGDNSFCPKYWSTSCALCARGPPDGSHSTSVSSSSAFFSASAQRSHSTSFSSASASTSFSSARALSSASAQRSLSTSFSFASASTSFSSASARPSVCEASA